MGPSSRILARIIQSHGSAKFEYFCHIVGNCLAPLLFRNTPCVLWNTVESITRILLVPSSILVMLPRLFQRMQGVFLNKSGVGQFPIMLPEAIPVVLGQGSMCMKQHCKSFLLLQCCFMHMESCPQIVPLVLLLDGVPISTHHHHRDPSRFFPSGWYEAQPFAILSPNAHQILLPSLFMMTVWPIHGRLHP